jgi:hypothetical protein
MPGAIACAGPASSRQPFCIDGALQQNGLNNPTRGPMAAIDVVRLLANVSDKFSALRALGLTRGLFATVFRTTQQKANAGQGYARHLPGLGGCAYRSRSALGTRSRLWLARLRSSKMNLLSAPTTPMR